MATNTTTATRTAARAVDSSQANNKTLTPSNLKYKVNG
jgi:hypothetical protein